MKKNNMSGRIHPMIAAAAAAVILVSLVGVAAITGILPNSKADQAAEISKSATQATPSLASENKQKNNAQDSVKHSNPVKHSPRPAQENYQQQAAASCSSCGRVESVKTIQSAAQPSGVGVGVGAVIGGLLGNQVGGGNGRTLATVAGAVGGGYAGNEVEKRSRVSTSYQVRVRMDDGQLQTFPSDSPDSWRTGDEVRVVNGSLTSRN
ncbi:MAG: outer membrane lipoprotein SlyB [Burkholderiaceae bacterium]|jgi:outer membrane lipoprotein SlyB